jgi:hypothetical protein
MDAILDAAFWSHVDKEAKPGCWLWTASCDNTGHPQFWFHFKWGRSRVLKVTRTLRMQIGPHVPVNTFLLHTCGNKRCVNPGHTEAVPYAQITEAAHAAQWQNFATAEDWLRRGKQRILDHSEEDPETGCWLWLGGKQGIGGYGSSWFGKNRINAHRLSWAVFKNAGVPPPKGMVIMHSCDTRACVNPDHLNLSTYKENSADMVAKQRHSYGSKSPCSVLNEEIVSAMRKAYIPRRGEVRRLAALFGVSQRLTRSVLCNGTWPHVKWPTHRTVQRASLPRPDSGENSHNAKLTWPIVRAMREARERGATYDDIVAQFKVPKGTVANVLTRKSWAAEPAVEAASPP